MNEQNQWRSFLTIPVMIKEGFLFVLFSVCFTVSVQAQQWPFELWHDGKIILEEGDTLKGSVKYDLEQNIVQYAQQNQNATVLSARKVLYFEIFDRTVHQYRQFFALPYSSNGSYRAPEFFELLAEGKLTLLCKEGLEYRSVPVGYYGGSYSRLILVYKYYTLNDKGDIVPFTGKKHDLLDMMGKNADVVEKYIRANRLRIEDKPDFAKIVAFYNSLYGS
jgi:hypothetical protein